MKQPLKIWITGTNSVQCQKSSIEHFRGGKGVSCALFASIDVLKKAFGAENVKQSPVLPSNRHELADYDVIVLYPMPIGGWSSGFALGAAYAMCKHHGKVVLGVDDWQIHKAQHTMDAMARALRGAFWSTESKAKVFDNFMQWRQIEESEGEPIRRGFEALAKPWDRPMIAPTFYGGGDMKDLGIAVAGQHGPHLCFDPSSYFVDSYKRLVVHGEEKRRRWVFSSLVNRTPWLDEARRRLKWEIAAYGNKTSGHSRVKESELVMEQAMSWGVLTPPSGHSTGLWWRNRVLFAAQTKSIIAGDPRETQFYGASYAYWPSDIERLNDEQLRDLAEDQRDEFFKQTWTRARFHNALKSFFEKL
jgi:hypothetical protein